MSLLDAYAAEWNASALNMRHEAQHARTPELADACLRVADIFESLVLEYEGSLLHAMAVERARPRRCGTYRCEEVRGDRAR